MTSVSKDLIKQKHIKFTYTVLGVFIFVAKPFQWQLVDSTATIEAVSDVIWKKVIDFDMPKLGM